MRPPAVSALLSSEELRALDVPVWSLHGRRGGVFRVLKKRQRIGDDLTGRLVIYLVSCGKTKRSERSRAEDLYTGCLFRDARRYVESLGSVPWWILSAEHGLVHPEAELDPYEATLTRGGREKRQAWATKVMRQLVHEYGRQLEGATVVLLAGEDYASELLPKLSKVVDAVRQPLHGLQAGERRRWYKENTRGR